MFVYTTLCTNILQTCRRSSKTNMPTGSKTAVAGRGRTNDSATILDPRNGMYTCKPYQPHLYDFKYREYKYKPYKQVYEDPLRKKTEVIRPYRSYVPQVSYKRSLDYQLPKQGDLLVRKEEPIIRESFKVKAKSPKQSQPARKPPVVVTNNNIYNEATHLKRFRYQPLFSKISVLQYHRFIPPVDW
ncbi:hypothetical protein CHS0354_021569 [Potamilus streckersoni]|uniref:Uncharacterized protein n=1 Tax=Potamilus streckersoni TaxID=2493646 RepID=A0AAE0W7G8_9BIVA|nr:hypothetical protein CHS0354_021569 [Potamilus streckersoni]